MEHEYDCHTCGSMYKISWEVDEVELPYSDIPEYCPCCGIKLDNPADDIGIDFKDKVDFNKSVDLMDGDGDEF
jgi:hypothetical protein